MKKYLFSIFVFTLNLLSAQQGKDLSKAVTTAGNIVNEYTTLTANASAGDTFITVAASGLNANGRFTATTGTLAAGDLIMIIQMQGATINGSSVEFPAGSGTFYGIPNDATWGDITNYNNCGNYELVQVSSVPSTTRINIDCSLKYDYTAAGKVQVIRVPRYSSLTITNPGTIIPTAWTGSIGGVVAIEVSGNTVINSVGGIDVSGRGFRGGALSPNNSTYGGGQMSMPNSSEGADKGEGIAGYQSDYTIFGGRYARGAAANAGGGGNCHNAAGGGGSNAGNIAAWNGFGNPDNSVAGWTTAWNLEGGTFSANTSSGGGRGGYTFAATNQDATVVGPWTGALNAWNGDYRRNTGGLGGRPLDYSLGKLFLGGGGGAGDGDNSVATAGGIGGGLVYLMNYGTLSGTGSILANGGGVANSGRDGGGGAGGGGTIVLNSVGVISGISTSANGGIGGNQVVGGAITESEGPGGGGGGGYIALSNGAIAMTANGGANGTTNSNSLTEFPPNGATSGGIGLTNQPISNFTFTAANVTICSNNTATLTVTLTGTVPGGTVVTWYSTQTGGVSIGTGTTFTTPVLTTTTTYYVGTCPGNYRIPVTVTVGSSIIPTITGTTSICAGQSTTLTGNGGGTYSWDSGATTTSITVSPGSTTTYTLTVNSGGCTGTATAEVTVNSLPTPVISGTTTICSGGTTTLSTSGGGTYSWNDGSTTSSITITPVSTNTYSVTVTNSGCSGTASQQVTIGPGLSPSITGTTTICGGSTTTLSTSGGGTYSWSDGSTTSSITITPASTNTYSVTVINSGCSGTASVQVVVNTPPAPVISGTTTICSGSATTLSTSGGGTYSWNDGSTTSSITVTPALTSTYSVIVTNSGCSGTASQQVTIGPGLSPSITGTTTICSGGTTTLSTSGGGTYSWNDGSTASSITITPVSTNTYSVTVINSGCSGTASVQVIVNTPPAPVISGTTIICSGGTTTLSASGGGTYSWNDGSTTSSITVTPVSTNTYSVTVTNSGCSGTASQQVTIGPGLSPSISGTTIICSGGTTTLSTSGGGIYSWNDGSTASSITVAPTSTNTYSVIVTNSGCSGTASVQVVVNTPPAPVISGTTIICSGGSTTLSASGGGTYSWNDGSTTSSITVTPALTSTYSVIVTNSGCSGTASQQVTIGPGLSPSITGTTTICSGGSTILSTSGGGTYSWNEGSTTSSITVSPVSPSTYTVTVVNGSCSGTASVQITVGPSLTPIITGTTTICSGGTTTLSTSGGGTYSWNNGSTTSSITVTPVSINTYTVTVINSGCSGTASVQVNVNPNPVPIISGSTTLCSGNTTTLNTSGGGTYSWSPGGATSSSITITPVSTTTYTVTITNGTCSNSATQVVTVTPPLVANITGNSICKGGNTTLTASGGTSYIWNTGGTSSVITISPVLTTTYSVTASVGLCSATASYTVVVDTLPIVTVSPDITITYGTTTTLNVTGGGTYNWSPTNGLSCSNCTNPVASPTQTTQYCVIVSNSSGCSVNECVTVTVDIQCGEVFVPNAFSPNNDSENDLECVFGNCIQTMTFAIFDRWGEKVFETSDPKQCWDGIFKGELMNTAVFVYYLKATLITGEEIKKKGNISLVR